jgi:dolichol-phosphate mannosyltransferase
LLPQVSIIVPTLNESQNIGTLLERLLRVCSEASIEVEIVVVDDGSTDGTVEAVERLAETQPVRLVRRPGKMGITSAVLDGAREARGSIIGVMDADLSHPPEKIPELAVPIIEGRADMTIASRYAPGGGCTQWPLSRRLVSRGATILSRPVTGARDPMSGFFFARRELIDSSAISEKGWKICLEILVRSEPERVLEIPYVFANRASGSSKMGMGTIGDFIANLADLYAHRFFKSDLRSFLKFCTVGGVGILLNLAILYSLVEYLGLWYLAAATLTFFIVASNNFLWNKVWTFGDRRRKLRVVGGQLGKFLGTSVASLAVNLLVLSFLVEYLGLWYILGQMGAIAVAVIVNFALNSLWVFSDRPRN